jgi:hypothetical protein
MHSKAKAQPIYIDPAGTTFLMDIVKRGFFRVDVERLSDAADLEAGRVTQWLSGGALDQLELAKVQRCLSSGAEGIVYTAIHSLARDEGHKEGYDEGFDEGKEEGIEEGREEANDERDESAELDFKKHERNVIRRHLEPVIDGLRRDPYEARLMQSVLDAVDP